jgi:hypothetical protein
MKYSNLIREYAAVIAEAEDHGVDFSSKAAEIFNISKEEADALALELLLNNVDSDVMNSVFHLVEDECNLRKISVDEFKKVCIEWVIKWKDTGFLDLKYIEQFGTFSKLQWATDDESLKANNWPARNLIRRNALYGIAPETDIAKAILKNPLITIDYVKQLEFVNAHHLKDEMLEWAVSKIKNYGEKNGNYVFSALFSIIDDVFYELIHPDARRSVSISDNFLSICRKAIEEIAKLMPFDSKLSDKADIPIGCAVKEMGLILIYYHDNSMNDLVRKILYALYDIAQTDVVKENVTMFINGFEKAAL